MKPTPSLRRKASACQRVSGHHADENRNPEFQGPRGRESGNPRNVLLWPESIPKGERKPLSTGHRSFLTGRQVVPEDMMRGQEVDIRGHVLITCERSRLLIERGMTRVLIETGQSVLLSNTKVTLSELPVASGVSGYFFSFFFSDEVLAGVVPMHPQANAYLFRAADYPCPDGIIPLPYEHPSNLWIPGTGIPLHMPSLSTSPDGIFHLPYDSFNSHKPPTGIRYQLHPMLTRVFNRPDLSMWKLCLKQIVVPRIRVMVFLENLLLHSTEEHAAIEDRYPGGSRALHQEMRRLKMPTIAALLEQRRFELCFSWRNYADKPFEDILAALHISQPGRFLASYERWLVEKSLVVFTNMRAESFSDSLLAAHPSFLPSIRGQYWNRREAENALDEHRKKLETDEDYRFLQEIAAEALANNPSFLDNKIPGYVNPFAPFEPPGEMDPSFWEMKSTGAAMVIKAEGFTLFPGLEDCADLLMAA